MARYFQKLAEARWRKHLDKLEGDELYDMAHKIAGDPTTGDKFYGNRGQRNLSDAYRHGITDKRVIKAIVSEGEGNRIRPSIENIPVKDLDKYQIRFRKDSAEGMRYERRLGGPEKLIREHNENLLKEPVPGHWGSDHGVPIDPEREVKIVHGGGEKYLKKVIEGREAGYAFDKGPGKGIQVHPLAEDVIPGTNLETALDQRTRFYADRGVAARLDSPVSMTGTIKAKFLHAAPNGYEAGLPAENLKHVKNMVITKLPVAELPSTVKNIIDRISKLKR